MSQRALDSILTRLNSGNAEAAEQVFVMFEPLMRMVVRRKLSEPLQAKLDSTDVVQSVWADALDGFRAARWRFRDTAHLKAFLVTMTRNRLIDHFRRHRNEIERVEPLAENTEQSIVASPLERASELVQADELWQQMLAVCPPRHIELLRLKRQGLSMAEVAARTGLNEGSVRRILCDVAHRLRLKQPASDTSRERS